MGPTRDDFDRWELDLRDQSGVSPAVAALVSIWSWTLGCLVVVLLAAIASTLFY